MDLILTNCRRSFQNICALKTGLSDFHKMIATVMKKTFRKLEPKVTECPNYRYFAMILSGSL